MRHRRRGRVLGRSPSHRRALFANLISALFLTERETSDLDRNAPKVKGRIVTTIEKAKEVRPMVEKCITIAKKALASEEAAKAFGTDAERNTEAYKAWRKSDNWKQWVAARGPAIHARRRVLAMIRDKQAVAVLFETIAPVSSIAPAATPVLCGWPSLDWAITERERCSNSWEHTIESRRRLRSRRLLKAPRS